MKDYYLQQEFGFKDYWKVMWDNGSYGVEMYQGTQEECERWISRNS